MRQTTIAPAIVPSRATGLLSSSLLSSSLLSSSLLSSSLLLAGLLLSSLSACTWVHMAPGASAVRVVSAAPANCQNRGEVEVSVKERLGPYERNTLRVRDELETLARNEAPGLGGDTVQPLDGYEDGNQRYTVWRCGG